MKVLAVFVGILLVQCASSEESSEHPSSSSPKSEASGDTKSSIAQVGGNPIDPKKKENDISIQKDIKEASTEKAFVEEPGTTNEKNVEEECAEEAEFEEGINEEQRNKDSYDDEACTMEGSTRDTSTQTQEKGKEVTESPKTETVKSFPKVILRYYHLPRSLAVVSDSTFVTPRPYRGPLSLLPPVYGSRSHHRRPPVAYVPTALRSPVKVSYEINPIPMHPLMEPDSINYASYFGLHPPSVGISPPAPQLVAFPTFELTSNPGALLPPFGIPPIDISPPTIGSEFDSLGPELFTAPSPLRVPPPIVEGPFSMENSYSFIPSSVTPPYTSPLPLTVGTSPDVITSGRFARTEVTPLTYPSVLNPYVCAKVLSSPILRKIPNLSECFKNYL